MSNNIWVKKTVFPALLAMFLASGSLGGAGETGPELVGAWRGRVQFTTGAFAAVQDIDFMYLFNAGGTMLESSNYDGAPPVPPAYGVWRKVGDRKYQAKYSYYATKPPASFDEIARGGGWGPGGYGLLTQEITLAADGKSFESTIRYEIFDQAGKPVEKESSATARAVRLGF
ncbi:MAG: hypothetical protein PSW75_08470 [bacterium]|nr:hypothetical protein [bacterium]MDI1335724.1 hypothetical protein [Lacunisphaera sp.]